MSLPVRVSAQQQAFESLQFGFIGGTDLFESELHETWSIPGIAELSISTPFYFGDANLNATFLPASSRREGVTDFWAIYAGAGIGYPIEITPRIRLSPELRFGSMYMNFDDEQVDFRKEESEIFVGGRLSVATSVSNSTEIEVSTVLLHTFTEVPINVSAFNVGILYRIGTPRWLKRILQ